MKDAISPESVDEFQGLYGPFTVSERLLQKIWLKRDFNLSAARTMAGARVEVLFSGKWNRLAGPDFRDARLRVDGRDVTGDVEIHFRPGDWRHHGHDCDPAYNRVVLHVVLFGADNVVSRTAGGKELPQMELLTLLHHDLEAYAANDAIEAGFEARHWKALEEILLKENEERRKILLSRARERWKQKVHFARIRVERAGWEEACHLTALEILGYRRNRPAMLDVATRFPLDRWAGGEVTDEEIQAAFAERWRASGTRPANDPRLRLRQYARWVEARGRWPAGMRRILEDEIVEDAVWEDGSGAFRRRTNMAARRRAWGDRILAGAVGGRRFETLFCDGFFPLLATEGKEEELFPFWFHWYPGDYPESVFRGLRTAEIVDGRDYPLANGWCQGLLGLTLDRPDSVSL